MNSVIENGKSFKRRTDMLKSINEFDQYKTIIIGLEYDLELLIYFKIRSTNLSYR